MSLVYTGNLEGYELKYFNDGTAIYSQNGCQLWRQTWNTQWTDFILFKSCNNNIYLISYKNFNGELSIDLLTNSGYTQQGSRLTLETNLDFQYFKTFDGRNDVIVSTSKTGVKRYYDFECPAAVLKEFTPTTIGLIPGNSYGTLSVRSSSNWSPDCSVVYSQINYKKGNISSANASSSWHALTADDKQWVSLSSVVPVEFHQIQTQGRGDDDLSQWVTSYKIRYTLDDNTWVDGPTFQANTDRHTVVTNTLSPPIIARTIAIHPLTWQGFVTMRFDALYRPIKTTTTKTGMIEHPSSNEFCNPSTPGDRYAEYNVKFDTPFIKTPSIICALTQIDCAEDKNLRIRVFPKNITKDGFTFVFMTWFDTKLYSLRGSYVATLDV